MYVRGRYTVCEFYPRFCLVCSYRQRNMIFSITSFFSRLERRCHNGIYNSTNRIGRAQRLLRCWAYPITYSVDWRKFRRWWSLENGGRRSMKQRDFCVWCHGVATKEGMIHSTLLALEAMTASFESVTNDILVLRRLMG